MLLRRQIPSSLRSRHQLRQSSVHHLPNTSPSTSTKWCSWWSPQHSQWRLSSNSWQYGCSSMYEIKSTHEKGHQLQGCICQDNYKEGETLTMRGASYLTVMTSLNHWNRRLGPSEHRERRWSLVCLPTPWRRGAHKPWASGWWPA